MFEVEVRSSFRAAHAVHLPDGRLEPSHEHDWGVVVTVRGPQVDHNGLLVDFLIVQQRLEQILEPLRGTDLNSNPVLAGRPPSAEMLARHLYEHLERLDWRGGRPARVVVHEAAGCSAAYLAPTDAARPRFD